MPGPASVACGRHVQASSSAVQYAESEAVPAEVTGTQHFSVVALQAPLPQLISPAPSSHMVDITQDCDENKSERLAGPAFS